MPEKRTDLLHGTLDMLILKTLRSGRKHGFAIAARIKQVSDNILTVEEGSLYPALHRLQRRGWIASEWGVSRNNRRAKFYRLTTAGRRRLSVEEANWQRLSTAINLVLGAT